MILEWSLLGSAIHWFVGNDEPVSVGCW